MVFYCPSCWYDVQKECYICPACGFDIRAFFENKDYVDKLVVALSHPDAATPVRSAWILGQRREERAIEPLYNLARHSPDLYVVAAAVKALLDIGTAESLARASVFSEHPSIMIRNLFMGSMPDNSTTQPGNDEKHFRK